MTDFETTEMKLRSTPTGGVSGEHSPYYRRLLSAGYKGFLQGTIGGAGFYGLLGAGVGLLLAIPTYVFFPQIGIMHALAFIPTIGAMGVVKGASTFGNIGTMAAISAESADLTEQRRYLLDRYYDLPDGPEGDKQAAIIKEELVRLQKSDQKKPLLHWKTVAIGALIGAALALVIAYPPLLEAFGEVLKETALGHAVEPIAAAVESYGALAMAGIGTTFGALIGATIGIDRHYVRQWFDGSEKVLHTESHTREELDERAQQLDRLRDAAKADNQTKLILERRRELQHDTPQMNNAPLAAEAEPKSKVAHLDSATLAAEAEPKSKVAHFDAAETPDTKIHSATLQHRLADIQQAMQIPAV